MRGKGTVTASYRRVVSNIGMADSPECSPSLHDAFTDNSGLECACVRREL